MGFCDEMRVGLHGTLRRVWGRRAGHNCGINQQGWYESIGRHCMYFDNDPNCIRVAKERLAPDMFEALLETSPEDA